MRRKPVKRPKADLGKGLSVDGEALPAHRDPNSAEFWPSPDELFREAEEEPNYRNLSAYSATIGMLRTKGFSYREIAEWFSERGVSVDHNTVYRTYTNSLPGDLAQREEQDTALEEYERDRLDGVV